MQHPYATNIHVVLKFLASMVIFFSIEFNQPTCMCVNQLHYSAPCALKPLNVLGTILFAPQACAPI